jgi:hypothetical protein
MSTLSGTSIVTAAPDLTLQYRTVEAVSKSTGSLLLQPASTVAVLGSQSQWTFTGAEYQPSHDAGAGVHEKLIVGCAWAAAPDVTTNAAARAAMRIARFIGRDLGASG